jgi:hypothetical protein
LLTKKEGPRILTPTRSRGPQEKGEVVTLASSGPPEVMRWEEAAAWAVALSVRLFTTCFACRHYYSGRVHGYNSGFFRREYNEMG